MFTITIKTTLSSDNVMNSKQRKNLFTNYWKTGTENKIAVFVKCKHDLEVVKAPSNDNICIDFLSVRMEQSDWLRSLSFRAGRFFATGPL